MDRTTRRRTSLTAKLARPWINDRIELDEMTVIVLNVGREHIEYYVRMRGARGGTIRTSSREGWLEHWRQRGILSRPVPRQHREEAYSHA